MAPQEEIDDTDIVPLEQELGRHLVQEEIGHFVDLAASLVYRAMTDGPKEHEAIKRLVAAELKSRGIDWKKIKWATNANPDQGAVKGDLLNLEFMDPDHEEVDLNTLFVGDPKETFEHDGLGFVSISQEHIQHLAKERAKKRAAIRLIERDERRPTRSHNPFSEIDLD